MAPLNSPKFRTLPIFMVASSGILSFQRVASSGLFFFFSQFWHIRKYVVHCTYVEGCWLCVVFCTLYVLGSKQDIAIIQNFCCYFWLCSMLLDDIKQMRMQPFTCITTRGRLLYTTTFKTLVSPASTKINILYLVLYTSSSLFS